MRPAYDRRGLTALAFVFSLAPVMRLLPKRCTALAGSAAYVAPLIAAPFVVLYAAYMSAFLRFRRPGEGLGEMLVRAVGRRAGTVVLSVSGAFFVFYGGFILRSGAERFVGTVYPAASPWLFVFVMLLAGLIAALGPPKAVVRAARLIAPVLLTVLLLTVAFGLSSVGAADLLPSGEAEAGDLLRGAVPVFNVFAGVLAFAAFLEGPCPEKAKRTGAQARLILPMCLLLSALLASIVGNYGAALTTKLSHPYFTMVRDITVLRTLERMEALVVALWVFPDFIVTAVMLLIARRALALALGFVPREAERMGDMKNGRWLIPACAVLAAAVACGLPSDAAALERVSERIVPLCNLALTVGVYPVCFAVGKLRGTV